MHRKIQEDHLVHTMNHKEGVHSGNTNP